MSTLSPEILANIRRSHIMRIAMVAIPALIAKQAVKEDEAAPEGSGVMRLSGPQITEVVSAAYEIGAAFLDCVEVAEAALSEEQTAETESV